MISGLTAEEEQALVLSVGTHRRGRRLSPLEVARLLHKLICAGATRQACAARFQIGLTQVSAFLNLLKLAPEVQDLADWGNTSVSMIPFSSLAQLVGLREGTDQIQAARAILTHRLTWKEVVQLVQLRNRSGDSIEECITTVLKLRPEVERRHIFVGSVASEQLRRALVGSLQHERDELLRRSLKKILGTQEGFAVRLGLDRFTIVGSRDPARVLNAPPDVFERSLNDALVEESSKL